YFSPQQVLWTMVRITPTGELNTKPSSSWKGRFTLRDDNGKIKAEQPVRWMDSTMDSSKGSYVASAAFPMANIKLKDGGYSVALELKGPGIGKDFYEESPITAYGFDLHSSVRLQQHR
ncbi:MAG TPA: hypothetical protein VMU62_00595, partial [Acidobacteriaceae bacterium]|nr:hypothetical protein [Acidobacteriaceae bacterium]